MSADTTSSFHFARQPVLVIPTIDESFESMANPVDMQQPSPRVVNYWFDRLGLSLDTTLPENPSNPTSSPFQYPLFDGIIHVS